MRPILVLLLVLVAIAALLFGVFSLLGDDGSADIVGPGSAADTSTAVAPDPNTRLEGGDTPGREKAPQTAAREDTRAAARNAEFGNVLTGLVVAPDGTGLANATVSLSSHGTDQIVFVNDPVDKTQDRAARTDSEGRYVFENVTPRDKYRLIAEHPDYARTDMLTNAVDENGRFEEPPLRMRLGARLIGYVSDSGGNRVPDTTLYLDSMFVMAGGEPADRMVARSNAEGFYAFENVPTGHEMRNLKVEATGYATITVQGLLFRDEESETTRDITLQPALMLSGRVVGSNNAGLADVRVVALGTMHTQQGTRSTIHTDETGAFLFEDLSPGKYMLQAAKSGWRYRSVPRVEAGEANVIIEMLREANVSGRVVDAANSQPVPAFQARLRFHYQEDVPTAPSDIQGTFTAGDGEFSLEGVKAGKYVVEGMAPGYAPSFSLPFTVSQSQDVTGIEVRMSPGGVITGRVMNRKGEPIEGARVRTEDNEFIDDLFQRALGNSFPTDATAREARTDKEGRFELGNLHQAKYQVIVNAPGFTELSQKEIVLAEGAAKDVGDLRLGRGGTLRGTLYDGAGNPIVAGRVTLEPAFLPENGDVPKRYDTKSGSDGKYIIANVAPGTYRLMATRNAGNAGNPFQDLLQAKNSEQRATLTEGETVTQDLTVAE